MTRRSASDLGVGIPETKEPKRTILRISVIFFRALKAAFRRSSILSFLSR